MMTPPLKGLRVLDLSRLLPGPFCSLMLADLGAEVIKVEEPTRGDYAREYKVAFNGVGASFAMLNRNKKSLTLNLKTSDGVSIFKALARTADVVIEGFRPGVMDRLGVGYETLKDLNSGLIYCALTGYGQTGPYKDRVGHDINYCGYAGLLDITGARGGGPVQPGVQVADIGGGALTAAVGILAAVHGRRTGGEGRYIDISMMDGALAWMMTHLGAAAAGGETPARGEMRLNGGLPCYHTYECEDGAWITLGALEDKFWRNFCRLVGRLDLADDVYPTGDRRDHVERQLTALFKSQPRAFWLEVLAEAEVCCGPVLGVEDVATDPQVEARGMVFHMTHPVAGRIPQVACPIRLGDSPTDTRSPGREACAPAPALGEHTEEILDSLGYPLEAIRDFRADGVI